MRLFIYKFLAQKEIAVTLSDIENGFDKADRTTLDQSNRKKWKGTPEVPREKNTQNSVSDIYEMIQKAEIETIGSIDVANFPWTTNRGRFFRFTRLFL